MAEDSFDGTWTLIIGDDEANSKTTSRIVVNGAQAWDMASPDQIGTCAIAEDKMTIVLTARGVGGDVSSDTIIARLSDRRAFSGVITSAAPDGAAFCEPCVLIRKMGLSFRAPMHWSVEVSSHAA